MYDLAEEVRFVLTHEAEAQAVAQKAKATVQKNHDWSAIARQYHEICVKVARSRNR
jgi:spore maturation protein CgeB